MFASGHELCEKVFQLILSTTNQRITSRSDVITNPTPKKNGLLQNDEDSAIHFVRYSSVSHTVVSDGDSISIAVPVSV